MQPAEDPDHSGNSPKYQTGDFCMVPDCYKMAGTWWSKHWCQQHNALRLARVSHQLEVIVHNRERELNR